MAAEKTCDNIVQNKHVSYRRHVVCTWTLLVIDEDFKTGWRFWDVEIAKRDVEDKKDFRFLICGLAKRLTFEKQ